MAQTSQGANVASDGKVAGPSPKAFKNRLEKTKTKRRDLIRGWQENIDMRRMKPLDTDADENRIPIPLDWALTKAKVSQLFSQVPRAIASGEGEYAAAAPVVEKRLNKRLREAGIGSAMFEAFPDLVNAAGLAVCMVSYEARTEMRQVPEVPLEDLGMIDKAMVKMGLKRLEMIDQPFVVDRKFSVDRLSPGDFLWPVEFSKSDYDRSPWIGRSGRKQWPEALNDFGVSDERPNGLVEADREKCVGDVRTAQDRLSTDEDNQSSPDADVVSFDEIFYWRYLYHADEKRFTAIQRMVFVEGKDEPVINEPWNGQEYDEELGLYVGACRYPIRVLTTAYISDEAIPPSDTAVGRPQMQALIKFRQQMDEQRDHSKPVRWGDTNRIDADILTLLMAGDWNGIIPVQGQGDKALGEIARSNYPREDHEFEMTAKNDLYNAWGTGPNALGNMAQSGEHSAEEAKNVQANYSSVIGMERARGVEFFLGIADVMLGLMCLYDDFELPNVKDKERLEMWDRKRIKHELAFTIRGDSTVLVSAEQRIDRLMRFLNITGKSGYLAPKSVIKELASLHDLDPEEVVQDPPKKGPEPPNVSLRFSGAEDLRDPMVVSMLMGSGLAPTREGLKAAIELIAAAGTVVKTSLGSEKDEITTAVHVPGEDPGATTQPPPVEGAPPMRDDRPDLAAVDRINSRRDATQE